MKYLKYILGVLVVVGIVAFVFSPIVVTTNTNVKSFHFKNFFNKIGKYIPENQNAKLTDFYLLFNDLGDIQRFRCIMAVKSGQNEDLYYVQHWPKFKLTTISHSQIPQEIKSSNKKYINANKAFATLDNIDYNNVILKKQARFYTILSPLVYAEKKFPKEPGRENFMVVNNNLIKLNNETTYPESVEFMLMGDNKLIGSYLTR